MGHAEARTLAYASCCKGAPCAVAMQAGLELDMQAACETSSLTAIEALGKCTEGKSSIQAWLWGQVMAAAVAVGISQSPCAAHLHHTIKLKEHGTHHWGEEAPCDGACASGILPPLRRMASTALPRASCAVDKPFNTLCSGQQLCSSSKAALCPYSIGCAGLMYCRPHWK